MILDKAKNIRLLILDVDGVLTSGLLYYGQAEEPMRAFHIHDGLGIKLLQKSGIKVAVISAKKSKGVEQRLNELEVAYQYLGAEDKSLAYLDLKTRLKLTDTEIAYVGDDLPDLPVLSQVGLSISVPNAIDVVKKNVDFITQKEGGAGAVREICEHLMMAQEAYHPAIKPYLLERI